MAISISELIKQNTFGQSDGFPAGVPHSWSWYPGWNAGGQLTPPTGFAAVEGWGQVYPLEGASTAANASTNVEIANAKTYVHIKQTGQWVLVQDQSKLGLTGGHFLADFSGNSAYPMHVTKLPSGGTSFDAPPAGYNDHFWYGSRGTYAAETVDGVYVQMDMRITNPDAKLIGMVGVDWWRNSSAPFLADHSNNPGIGGTNWVQLSTQWKTVGYYSLPAAQFAANPPPPLLGSTEPTPVVPSDTMAPAAPKIVSFTPDTGSVGDKVTDASRLTLSGTAEAGSIVKVFDGSTQIGTAKASAGGAWTLATAKLSNGSHNFTAKATDVAGNTSLPSSLLRVTVSATSSPPVTTPPVTPAPVTSPPTAGANLLVNGSFEASSLAPLSGTGGRWGAFSSVAGWTALSGSKIEVWNNLVGVKASDGGNYGELDYSGARDGFYQDIKTVAGQRYDLSFDARSRPGFTASTCVIEVLWNGSVVATVAPGSAWQNHDFTVVGTGGQDRLTFREAADQAADGLGALYDNIELTAQKTPPVTSHPATGANNLLTNGSFEQSDLAALPGTDGRWGAFGSVAGWTAISGGTIELWNSLNGVNATDGGNFGELDYTGARDGFYQEVKTVAGQRYDLSFDARSRPGFTASTCSIEVLWNGSVVATVPPGSAWQKHDFTVVGTGGQDRLTFREISGQSGDGLGALYDNVSLVAKPAAAPSALANVEHSIDLMKQYSATAFVGSAPNLSSGVAGTSTNGSDQTLASPLHPA